MNDHHYLVSHFVLCYVRPSKMIDYQLIKTFSFIQIPTLVSWHSDSAIVMIANEKCRVQYFDISLACIRTQILNEDMVSLMVLELSTFFTNQPSLLKFCFSKKPELNQCNHKYFQSDSFCLVFILLL